MPNCIADIDTLLDHNQFETARWHGWFKQHPNALDTPCDIIGVTRIGEAVQHIFAVELRYAESVLTAPVSDYAALPSTGVDEIFGIHERALALYRQLAKEATEASLAEILELQTRTAGTVFASRRDVILHAMTHSMRHWAQIAVLLRHAGMPTGWSHDYLFFAIGKTAQKPR